MSIGYTLVSAFVAVSYLVAQSQAIELIEMNDPNQAILLLPLAKTLGRVQEAYKSNFDFKSVKAAVEFLDDCAYVNDVMSKSADEAYQGLAKKIKLVMAEPMIASACSTTPNEIEKAGLEALDSDFAVDNHDYLSVQKANKLKVMRELVKASPTLSSAFSTLLNKRIDELAQASLSTAVENINIFFDERNKPGFFDFNHMNYRSTCKLTLVKPICKLVRRSPDEDVSAISQDVADFIEVVKANDQAKLTKYQEASGVSLEDVKAQCASMKDNFGSFLRPIELIEKWIANGLMDEQEFQDRLSVDRDLAFYNELNMLCKLTH